MNNLLYDNLSVNELGHLTVSGHDTVELANEYGTALYVMDEDKLRENCRKYTRTMAECFPEGSSPSYASKALSFTGIYKIVNEEGMSVDVVSCGEIYTALRAGFPAQRMYFHGSNKTLADINFAMDNNVGYFVIDNMYELECVARCARERGIEQKALLRITPGIDPHTFEAVNTGQLDCQFGVPITEGLAFAQAAYREEGIELMGFHCHIGSQIFDFVPFCDAADMMFEFIRDVRNACGFETKVLDLGGGFGVRYVDTDPYIDVEENLRKLAEHINNVCAELDLTVPSILLEPGRSIVADAGLTLYTVGCVKSAEGCSNYVLIDGGMSDNPRYALYDADYTVMLANRAGEKADYKCTVAGRCCESGALIQENVMLPQPQPGDIIAVLTTGAYNYSMASNYNRLCRPAIIMVSKENVWVGVRREILEDLVKCDM
ncbi:MAG: diaminopimelate decarboxylase [Ruminococcaceae bacterium]|nr:diaminopimelate decarboxylase [Oscillospiraceae bacterium]